MAFSIVEPFGEAFIPKNFDNPELPMEFTKTGFSDTNARIFPNVSCERATKGKQIKSPAQIPAR